MVLGCVRRIENEQAGGTLATSTGELERKTTGS
jgi:hypothetical protein